MQTDIIIDTEFGQVLLAVTTPTTFDLVGVPQAIEALQKLAPVLKPTGNSTDIAPDVLGRFVYQTANEGLTQRGVKLTSHDQMVSQTFTENPLVMFQTRVELHEVNHALAELFGTWGIPAETTGAKAVTDALAELQAWETRRVFIEPAEAEAFVAAQKHRYAPENEGKTWRIYTGIADGQLKRIVRDARTLASF